MNTKMIRSIVLLMRPKQWIKSLFVFLPMFFHGELLNLSSLGKVFVLSICFSLVSSMIYCINDWMDVERDRLHPKKKMRPLASGAIAKTHAFGLICTLAILVGLLCWTTNVDLPVIGVIVGYFILNIAYSVWLKNVAILDVMIIAIGFVLRIVAGGFAANIPISQWIIIMTFLITLFMALAKRMDDVKIFEQTGQKMRQNIHRYSVGFLNVAMSIVASITIVGYILYCLSPEVIVRYQTQSLYVTSVFVLGGILRYLQIALVDECSGSPTRILLHDRFIQAMMFLWGLFFSLIIYSGLKI